MKRLASVSLAVACSVALTAPVWMGTTAAAAPTVKTPATYADMDPGGIGGVWIGADYNVRRNGQLTQPEGDEPRGLRDADGKPVEALPWAMAIQKQRMQDAKDGHPFANTKSRCLPAGLPGSMKPPHTLPIQIIFSPGQVTILLEEFNIFRIIHIDGRAHPPADELDPTFFGHSIGHWEGKTLVVDSVGINTETTFDTLPHSEDMHVVERYTRTGDRLDIMITIEDPKTFPKPWVQRSSFASVPGVGIREYFCEGDRNKPDETGRTGVQLMTGN